MTAPHGMPARDVAPLDLVGPSPARRLRADRARQVADVLRQQVVRGAFGSGALPDERALAAEFAASRNTIREALAILGAEGLIERVPSVGTLVVNQKYCHGLDRLMGLAETLHEHGTVTNEVRVAELVRPPRSVAGRLRVPESGPVIYVERLRRLNNTPLSLDLTYLTAEVGRPLLDEDLEHRDIFVLIEQLSGQRLGSAEVTMEAVNADAHSAAVLDVPKGAALLVVERLTHLDDGRPVDLEFIRFRGDRLTMRAQLARGGEGGPR